MEQEIIIKEIAKIKNISKEISLFSVKRKKIKVEIDIFNEEENKQLENRINKYYNACGCSEGRVTGIITFIGYIILVSTGIISIYRLGIGNTILLYFACSFVTMLIGKIYGLWYARRSLTKLSDQLQLNAS